MKNMEGHTDFNPDKDIPPLEGKVIFITGGTAGIGAEAAKAFAAHDPLHIYISGRNRKAGEAVISDIKSKHSSASMTFVEMDLSSMASVKAAVSKTFKHNRLDILLNNAGIMAQPASLSTDGYEIQFATNHLGHAMLTHVLLPVLLSTAVLPASDVRVVNTTSLGYAFHPGPGISFAELDAGSDMQRTLMGGWVRYGHSKLANILFATEFAKRYPQITSLSAHPGVVNTDLVYSQSRANRWFIGSTTWLQGMKAMEPHQGCWNMVWCAAVAKKGELKNGSFYYPVGVEQWDMLYKMAKNGELAERLWVWTEGVLAKF
ncbi:NAD(P)-binding protein [Massarina eburnea CBS 473.64]|uniref:NAD(P)-binding protein n=1 Tax=Massarina eburnea CBS 473.64 TaxID=1395130 RepID=A0A6A6RLS2_9PLEO|nr:NAD(P)-binding protein [Massarina eburnea CBS 473.64]